MDTQELLKKVRKIEIKTRGLSNQIFSGDYHSAFKGKGIIFSEVREYQYGDDIRNIDWHVTARMNHPYVKLFEEERELIVILLIDMSASEIFGTSQIKRNIITEVAAVLSFSAIQNNDKIGVIFFTDKVEKFIPPKKGKKHILRIIRELIEFKAENKKTNIAEALRYLTNVIKKRSTAFILSDFLQYNNTDFEQSLRIANNKHDLIALRFIDKKEEEIPDIGLVKFIDPETNTTNWIDTSSKIIRENFKKNVLKYKNELYQKFKKAGIDFAEIPTHLSYVTPLKNLFKQRELRR